VGWGERFIGKERVREGVSEFFTKFPDGRLSDGHHFISGNRGSTVDDGLPFHSTFAANRKGKEGDESFSPELD
jgi:hypothetical protein